MKCIIEKPAINLNHYAWKTSRGDLTLIGTWLLTDERRQPCMAIVRRGEEKSPHTVPCIIPVDRAWVWDVTVGDASQRTFSAFEFCEALRLEPTRKNIINLMKVVDEYMGDFLSIPPYAPPQEDIVIGEMVAQHMGSGKTYEFEMRADDV